MKQICKRGRRLRVKDWGSQGKNRKEVYNRHTTEKQPAETVGTSQGAQPGGTDTPSRMNAPTLPVGKGSENVGDT